MGIFFPSDNAAIMLVININMGFRTDSTPHFFHSTGKEGLINSDTISQVWLLHS